MIMATNIKETAEAFSRHEFGKVYPQLASDVRWVAHGGPTTVGRDAVIAVCERTRADLATTEASFPSWRAIVGDDAVVVDVVARYDRPAGSFVVASCDIYEFVDGMITTITSYVSELPADTG